MSIPNRKKAILYGVLLGGAVSGLLIDRLRATDSATAPAAALAGTAGSSTVAVTSAQPEVKGPPLARIFTVANGVRGAESRPAETEGIRNAFVLTPTMQQIYAEASPIHKAEQARQIENKEELRQQELNRFQSAHKLKGTSLREGEAWALIDDKIVRVGEQIDGFVLRGIECYRVELAKNDLTAILALPIP